MIQNFKDDYYRMTGKNGGGGIKSRFLVRYFAMI